MREDDKKMFDFLDAVFQEDPGQEVSFALITMAEEMLKMMGKKYPYYVMLHMMLHRIPDPGKRVSMISHYQDLAEKQWPKDKAKEFVKQASWLVHTYTSLHWLLINNKLPDIYPNQPDKNECVLFVRNITPQEMVAIAQSIYYSDKVENDYMGIVLHILRHSQYLNQLLTVDAFDFCKYLYLAHGFCMHIEDGNDNTEDKSGKETALPSIDTLDCELRNACFDVYIELRLAQIKTKLKKSNRRLYPVDDDEAYSVLCKSLNAEYTMVRNNSDKIWNNVEVQDSMVTALQFLAQYAEDNKNKFINNKTKTSMEEKGQTIINVTGDYVQSKHVDYEVGNVAEGGIGIQVVNNGIPAGNVSAEETTQPAPEPQPLPAEQPTVELTDGTIDQHRQLFKEAMLKVQDRKITGTPRYLLGNTYDWVAAERWGKDLGIITNYAQLEEILQDKRFRKVPKDSRNLTKYRSIINEKTRFPNWQCSDNDKETFFRRFLEIAQTINSIYQLGCKNANIRPYGSPQ